MLYDALEAAGIDFERQAAVPAINTIPDALIGQLAIYCDGDYWHCKPNSRFDEDPEEWQLAVREKDARITAELQAAGYTVLRFWGSDIRADLPACIRIVKDHLAATDE